MKDWRNYQNYFIIILLSLISVFVLPLLGSELGLAFNIPNSVAGWLVWCITKIIIVIINVLLFDQFVKQAKVNIKDNEYYKKAKEILDNMEVQLDPPRAPNEFLQGLYRRKGIKLAITTALSVFGLTNAILTFDIASFLTYLFTIIMGIIFGWITMNSVEEYWTDEYYRLALQTQRENSKGEKSNDNSQQ